MCYKDPPLKIPTTMARILVVDDLPAVGEMLAAAVRMAGHEPRQAQTFEVARGFLIGEAFDLVVCDVHLDEGHTGLELLRLREASPSKPQFVFVTGEAELETAVEALRAGAFDYIPKPIEVPRLLLAVAKALQARAGPPVRPSTPDPSDRLIGRTAVMVDVFNGVGRASGVDSPVLLVGEAGVGKEHVAREIHRHSPRAAGPFLVADAAVLPDGELPVAVLRAATGGTLYIEHVDSLLRPAQVRLARVVEKRPEASHDVRFIGSVEGPVEALARELYYVMSTIEIRIPPLRARRDDIPLLVEQALSRISPRVRRALSVDAEALGLLSAYDWPGNLREMTNVLERAAVRAPTGGLTATGICDLLPGAAGRPAVPVTERFAATSSAPRFQADRYVLTRVLRLTEMSETWEGVQPSLGRKVLVKFLAARGDDRVARFQREARIQATLRHPNIPAIFEAGVDPAIPCRMYIAMEFIEGTTLDRYVEALEPRCADRVHRVCDLVRQLAQALHYLHTKGIVHRDVKPENVLVNEEGRAILLDYGIARSFSHREALTSDNILVGSVPYMSPEQFAGRPEEVDWRTDVWGLGVTLYALLTGRVPFDGDTLEEISSKAIEVDPIPMREMDSTIPEGLEAVVLRALAKRPGERFGSAEEMAAALEEAVRA